MAIDPYSLCPCGSGKKLKFCCADLAGELEKIMRMLEGDQPAACLEHIRGLRKRDPDRASLLGLQAMLENELGRFDEARATIDHLQKTHPENVNGLAERAVFLAHTEGGLAAVDCVQSALERVDKVVPVRMYSALLVVSEALLGEGRLLAARAHILAAVSVAPEGDTTATEMLLGYYRERVIPLPFKVEWPLVESDAQVAATTGLSEAIQPAKRAEWRKAVAGLERLVAASTDAPAVWWNLALCRSWLGDETGAVEAFSRFTELAAETDPELAVEAAMLGQLLAPTPDDDKLDTLQVTYPVRDAVALETALDRSPRAERVTYQQPPGEDDGPPPRSAFRLLDRPLPAKGTETSLAEAPTVLTFVLIYGKQTDRDARLEFVANRGDDLGRIQALLGDADGEAIDLAQPTEEVLGQVSASQSALSWRMRLPDGLAGDERRDLLLQQRRETVLGRWPKIPLPALDGKTPEQAARLDPAMRARTLAAILVLRESVAAQWLEIDFDELRRALGLPAAEPIDPTGMDRNRIPMIRADRLIAEKLSEGDLVALYGRSCLLGAARASWKLGYEIVGRNSPAMQADLPEVHGLLASLEWDMGRALAHLDAARQATTDAGGSCARWDLAELSMRMENGEIQEARGLVTHIQGKHGREQGVMQGLYQILAAYGALGPAPTGPASPTPVAAAAAPPAAEIWTPGGQTAAGEGKKSGLWLPGMD